MISSMHCREKKDRGNSLRRSLFPFASSEIMKKLLKGFRAGKVARREMNVKRLSRTELPKF